MGGGGRWEEDPLRVGSNQILFWLDVPNKVRQPLILSRRAMEHKKAVAEEDKVVIIWSHSCIWEDLKLFVCAYNSLCLCTSMYLPV